MDTELNMNNNNDLKSPNEAGIREQIEKRAYEIWLAGGRRNGEDLRDWFQAVSEVLSETAQTKT